MFSIKSVIRINQTSNYSGLPSEVYLFWHPRGDLPVFFLPATGLLRFKTRMNSGVVLKHRNTSWDTLPRSCYFLFSCFLLPGSFPAPVRICNPDHRFNYQLNLIPANARILPGIVRQQGKLFNRMCLLTFSVGGTRGTFTRFFDCGLFLFPGMVGLLQSLQKNSCWLCTRDGVFPVD